MSIPIDPKRRELIRDLLVLSTVLAAIPSCLRGREERQASLKNLRLGKGQIETLSSLADLIIPRTETPGALDLEADGFALRMVDDCFRPEQRELFKTGLDAFDSAAKERNGSRFLGLDVPARKDFLQDLGRGGMNEEASAFLKVYRALVIRGYTESEHYLTRVRPYELVPGRFKGCVKA